MIIDHELLFCQAQAITADASYPSTPIDLGAAGDAIGQELTLHCVCSTSFTAGASDTIQLKLQTSADGSSWEDLVLSPALVAKNIKAGKDFFCVRVPQGMKRYVRLYFDVTLAESSSISAGKVTAFFSKDL